MEEELQIRFDDGAAYEAFMGRWSLLAGTVFLDWLAPDQGRSWIDVGCGNGAFTELLLQRCAPLDVQGIDPSPGQIDYARTRLAGRAARWQVGDAMALPVADAAADAAVMALVIFFVPEPARGVAEMVRCVRPGGSVSAYAWDILGGGFPYAAVQQEMHAIGLTPLFPPSVEAARMDRLLALWRGAGLEEVQTREIEVERTFADFEAFWATALQGPGMAPRLAAISAAERIRMRDRLRARLPAAADGSITCSARANAIKGRVRD